MADQYDAISSKARIHGPAFWEDLQRRASKDALSGLLNRATLEQSIKERLSAMTQEESCALFIVDLDNFKQVNDTLGHRAGDQAIRQAGRILSSIFRASDIVGRLGGDEFIIFVGASSQVEETREKLQKLLCRYVRKMEECWPLAHSTISAGGVYGDQPMTFAQLYKRADQVLYQVKQKGKGRIQLSPA